MPIPLIIELDALPWPTRDPHPGAENPYIEYPTAVPWYWISIEYQAYQMWTWYLCIEPCPWTGTHWAAFTWQSSWVLQIPKITKELGIIIFIEKWSLQSCSKICQLKNWAEFYPIICIGDIEKVVLFFIYTCACSIAANQRYCSSWLEKQMECPKYGWFLSLKTNKRRNLMNR